MTGSSFGRSNSSVRNKKEALQDSIKRVWSTPGCPVMTPCELGLPLQQWAAVGQQLHRQLSAEVHGGPPFEPSCASGGHQHPRLTGCLSTTSHHRDIYRADHSLTNRQVSRTARPAADPSFSTTIRSSLDCKPTPDVNKYCYICVILRLSLRTIVQHPTHWMHSIQQTGKLWVILNILNSLTVSQLCTKCNNLIPGIVTACRCGVESGKLLYSSTFGHVPTCVYMSYRPNDSFVPEQQRK